MTEAIAKTELARMFAGAAIKVREAHPYLSQLDSVAGDGDHGITMLRVVECMEQTVHHDSSNNLSTLLRDTGWSVMGVDGGASSALLGTFLKGMGDVTIDEKSMDCRDMANAFEAGLRAVAKISPAQPGDKTMMDALCPAVSAFRAAAAGGKNVEQAMEAAATAAQTGADSTKNFAARFGRAKFLQKKTLGCPDAGAVSIALLFSGFSSGLAQERKS